ncbi:MAG: hypothetical protein ACO3LE_06790 [Bdellovibrionota bacterium]|jgi:hypothetical protein
MTKRNQEKSNFPTGVRTVILEDLDEETWFHLLATIDARIFHFETRLREAEIFKDPDNVIWHYKWVIEMHKKIKETMRKQIWEA